MTKTLAVAIVPALFGCSILPSPYTHSTIYHDLGFPSKTFTLPSPVVVHHFDGDLGGQKKMRFRSDGNRIKPDPFNRWSQSPAGLLQRYLALAIQGTGNPQADVVDISGEIIRFDGDLDSKTATVCVLVVVSKVNNDNSTPIARGIFSASAPFDGESASSFAKAMGTAVEKLVAELVAKIKKSDASR